MRARRERRHRAKVHAQAASEEVSPTKTQRGGNKKKRKRRVRRKFGKIIRRVKKQRQRRQQRNKQIWQELHTTWLKKDSTEDQSVQPAEEKVTETSMTPTGSDMMKRSNENQYWLAVSQESVNQAASIERCVSDGVLFRVPARITGRSFTALIDSGASRCYMSPGTAAHCDLKLVEEKLYLELADGSKIQATQKACNVYCHVGKSVCRVDFTVTNLLHNVDLVLRINWLEQWNPVIDWQNQRMNIWTGFEWDQVNGMLLNSVHKLGTVKDFIYGGVSGTNERVPDFTVVKIPQFWDYDTGQRNEWKHVAVNEKIKKNHYTKRLRNENLAKRT